MKEKFTEPEGAPNIAMFRNSVQDSIIATFSNSDTTLTIVIRTIVFGTGIDCADVCQVIHWGPSPVIESYVQGYARAGRNGHAANTLFIWSRADFSAHDICQDMERYCSGKGACQRKMLMSYFDCTYTHENVMGCNCCDVCAFVCNCNSCNCKSFL